MSYDVAPLKKALDRYAAQRTERELTHARTVRELNERFPRLAEIEREISSCGLLLVENVMKGGPDVEANVMRIKQRVKLLRNERAEILESNGLPFNAIDARYSCEKCADTGYIGSEMCECLREVYRKEQYSALAELFAMSNGRLEQFDPMQYDGAADQNGISPRIYMTQIAESCKKYGTNFSLSSPSLFFCGDSGNGKTLFMASAARNAIEKNYSVIYFSAFDLAKLFEDDRFSKNGEADETLARLEKCDLLLIDSLGTEMTTAYTASALYQLLNRRLADKRPTIISSALNTDELGARYGSHLAARIRADFRLVPIYAASAQKAKNIWEM